MLREESVSYDFITQTSRAMSGPSMKNELSSFGCRKSDSPGWWRFSSPSALVGASPRPAWPRATLVDDSLSLRWREVFPSPLLFIEVWPTRRKDAQPSIQDRAATCGGARGKHVLRNRIQRDAAIHPDEARWRKGHRLLAQSGVVPSHLVHPSA